MSEDELSEIARAAEGLEYPSESDAPFELVRWDLPQGQKVEDVLRAHFGRRGVETLTLEAFFGPLAGFDERYPALEQAIRRTLVDAKVYRVGRRNIDIYILGRTPSGGVGGLRTTAVET